MAEKKSNNEARNNTFAFTMYKDEASFRKAQAKANKAKQNKK